MDDVYKIIRDYMILLLLTLPPFLYLYRYMTRNIKDMAKRVLVILLYWFFVLVLQNIIPAFVVIFLIWVTNKGYANDTGHEGYITELEGAAGFRLGSLQGKWRFSLSKFLFFSLIGIFIKVLVTYINLIVIVILTAFKVPLENQQVTVELIKTNNIWYIIYITAAAVFGAPILEEFVFRHWLYDRVLKRKMSIAAAAILSSLLFMTVHFNIQGAAAFFLIGIVNCMLYEKAGYWAAVANHFMFNLSSFAMLLAIKIWNIQIPM
jgi:membrane protease YdiL (CAAX protease family)